MDKPHRRTLAADIPNSFFQELYMAQQIHARHRQNRNKEDVENITHFILAHDNNKAPNSDVGQRAQQPVLLCGIVQAIEKSVPRNNGAHPEASGIRRNLAEKSEVHVAISKSAKSLDAF